MIPLVESYSLQHPVHLYHLLRGPCWFWWAKTRTVLGQNAINETSLGQIEVPRYLPDLTKKTLGTQQKLDTLQIQFVGPRPHPPLIHWACRLECRDAKLPMHLRKPRDAAMRQTHLAGGHPWATQLGEVAKRNINNGNIEYIDSLERS